MPNHFIRQDILPSYNNTTLIKAAFHTFLSIFTIGTNSIEKINQAYEIQNNNTG